MKRQTTHCLDGLPLLSIWPLCMCSWVLVTKGDFLAESHSRGGAGHGVVWRTSEGKSHWTWVHLGSSHWTLFFYTVFSKVPNSGSAVSCPEGKEGWALFLYCLLPPLFFPFYHILRCSCQSFQRHPFVATVFTRGISGCMDDCFPGS